MKYYGRTLLLSDPRRTANSTNTVAVISHIIQKLRLWIPQKIGQATSATYNVCPTFCFPSTCIINHRVGAWQMDTIWIVVVMTKWSIIPSFVWKAWRKPRKNSVSIVGAPAKIQAKHLPHQSTALPLHKILWGWGVRNRNGRHACSYSCLYSGTCPRKGTEIL